MGKCYLHKQTNNELMLSMLKICYYGGYMTLPVIEELEKKGYTIIYNQFSKDADIVLVTSVGRMYKIYPILKKIKKHKIKLVQIIFDVPIWRLSIKNDIENNHNYIIKLFSQYFYHVIHKHYYSERILTHFIQIFEKYKKTRKISQTINYLLNTIYRNKIFYQVNYKKLLKKSDLNLSVSKFTQFCVKKLLKVDSKVCYPSVNSKLINNLPKNLEQKYDAINISRIVNHKRQIMLVEIAKKLNLKIAIIGLHQDKSIKLDCPHFVLSHKETMISLIQSKIYVDPSVFEGFGLTPVEAAFLEKITIASDTYIHREVLGDYPIYFIRDDLDDLMNKINQVLNSNLQLNRKAIDLIKKKYSIESATNRLEKHLKSIIIKNKINLNIKIVYI